MKQLSLEISSTNELIAPVVKVSVSVDFDANNKPSFSKIEKVSNANKLTLGSVSLYIQECSWNSFEIIVWSSEELDKSEIIEIHNGKGYLITEELTRVIKYDHYKQADDKEQFETLVKILSQYKYQK